MSEDLLKELVGTFQPSDVSAMLLALRLEKMRREREKESARE